MPTLAGVSGHSFQSTLSMRRATVGLGCRCGKLFISIHALHEESDLSVRGLKQVDLAFQSTLSMRRATVSYTHLTLPTILLV